MTEFHTQGPVPVNSNAHAVRSFEQQVFKEVVRNKWVLLLGPRQHGKTTGLIRIQHSLKELGFLTATIDLQSAPVVTALESLFEWCAVKVATDLGNTGFSPPQGMSRNAIIDWLDAAIPEEITRVVIIIDEAQNIPDESIRNAFYGQIRSISTQRASEHAISVTRRLCFIFSGTFRPESMVNILNSPFNVCEHIYTDDLTIEAARSLASSVISRPLNNAESEAVTRIFSYVGGQPYLLQKMFSLVFDDIQINLEEKIQNALHKIKYNDNHISSLFKIIISDDALISIVKNLSVTGSIGLPPADQDHQYAQIIGIARQQGSNLEFRNILYTEVANQNSQINSNSNLPQNQSLLFEIERSRFDNMTSTELADFSYELYSGSVNAFKSQKFRLALVGFGACLEAIILDYLQSQPSTVLATAISEAKNNPRDGIPSTNIDNKTLTQPDKWTFANMIKVCRRIPSVTEDIGLSDKIREYRNYIHPSLAIQNSLAESDLGLDAQLAATATIILLRSIHP
ncbi:AAA-like domain-containing protein [Deinococcus sp. UYEF24]